MTDDEQGRALLDAVLDESDDAAVRLIYADWLDDVGQSERAELIRLQIALGDARRDCRCGRKDADHAFTGGQHTNGGCAGDRMRVEVGGRFIQARMRERELLREDGPLSGTGDRYFSTPEGQGFWIGNSCFYVTFRRGFVESVRCTLDAWKKHGPAIVRAHPVTRAEAVGREPAYRRETKKWRWYWMPANPSVELAPSDYASSLSAPFYELINADEIRWFESSDDALDAMSAAMIAWAKS